MGQLLVARGTNDVARDTATTIIGGIAVAYRRQRVLVLEVSPPPGPQPQELASRSLVDARAVPVLVGRR